MKKNKGVNPIEFQIQKSALSILLIGFIVLNLLSLGLPFFWDNVLLSAQFAYWFYENGFDQFILSSDIDCGHPPFFGWYLAAFWKLLGKTLWVSHLSMLHFLLIIAYHYAKLVGYFVPKPYQIWAALLVFCEPSIMAQCTMVSNDVVQLAGFVWGLSAIVYRKPLQIIPATLFLSVVSVRGAIIVFLLYLAGIVLERIRSRKWDFKLLLYFIPSLLFFVLWNYYHLQETGTALVGNNPKWAEHYESASLKTVLKHLIVITRNFLDFGRIFLWLGIIALFLKFRKSIPQKGKELLAIFTVTLLAFILVLITKTNPIGHRYFLPFYLLSILLLFSIIQTNKPKIKQGLFALIAIGLLTGNLWVYPEKIAQGWDSTLAHLHYFKLRTNMRTWLDQSDIPPEQIAAGFTMYRNSKYVELNEQWKVPLLILEENINSYPYLLYSNLINELSDEDIETLNTEWELIKEWRQMGVFLKIYKNPSNNFE